MSFILFIFSTVQGFPHANAISDEYIWAKTYGGELQKRPLDGSGSWTTVGNLGAGLNLFPFGGKVYMCYGAIRSMNLDGTGATTLRGVSSAGCVTDGNYIYYGYETTQAIGRMNMDGTGANDSWITWTNSGVYGMAMFIYNGFIYFGGGQNANSKVLAKVSLSGGTVTTLWTDTYAITGLATDGSYIYISHYGSTTVGRVNLDGSGGNASFISGLSYTDSWGVSIWNGKLYVANTAYILRANVDGTGVQSTWLSTASTARGLFITGTVATQITLSSTSIPSSAAKGLSTTISATFSAAGQVTFYSQGKRIAGCINVATLTNSPYTASCNWKPPVKGVQRISVSIAPSSSSNLALSTAIGSVNVVTRTTTR